MNLPAAAARHLPPRPCLPMVSEAVGKVILGMPEAVLLLRDDATVVLANRIAAGLLGYSVDDFVGLNLNSLINVPSPRGLTQWMSQQRLHLDSQDPARRILNARTKDGTTLPVEISVGRLPIASRLLIATFRDLSQVQQTEADLRLARDEIDRLRDHNQTNDPLVPEKLACEYNLDSIVGRSDALKRLLRQIQQVAATDASVLLLGETGTGKELMAQSIHAQSLRRSRRLVKVNCAALPSGLIESALFGHEKGAFTGALARELGCFEMANGGTIFLDEVGELQPELQSTLLRVLQDGEFQRVGSSQTQKVDVRVIAATNRDLHQAMQAGSFRSDLYFRLSVFPVEVPTLRARREDIPLLVWHIIADKQAKLGKKITDVPPAVMQQLVAYDWPGNIRELANVLERAIILSSGPTLSIESLRYAVQPPPPKFEASGHLPVEQPQSDNVDCVMRAHILSVLEACHWQIKGSNAAAERLGLKPSTLRHRMKRLGIRRS